MTQAHRQFILAPQRTRLADVPPRWHEQLSSIPDVRVVGVAPQRVQIIASDEALARIRERFGDLFHIEEIAPRDPT